MRWNRGAAIAAALSAAALGWGANQASAGKPGGGGGAPPGGTIYSMDRSSVDAANTYLMLAMDGNGGNRTVLTRVSGSAGPRASRTPHGGRRWFLTSETVPGEIHHGNVRRDVFAIREDGALRVRLTGAPTMQYWSFDWAPDEDASGATIGMLAQDWTGTTSSDTVVPGTWGFYTARLSFDGDGNVVGLDAPPTYAAYLGTVGNPGLERPDVWSWAWAPDMTRLAVESYGWGGAERELRVVVVASGAVTPLGPGERPDWSPDGSRIACRRFVPGSSGSKDAWRIETMNPDGSGRSTLVSFNHRVGATKSQLVDSPKWSPDGGHLAYHHSIGPNGGASWTATIYRVAANGSGNTNLTPEVAYGLPGLGFRDWR